MRLRYKKEAYAISLSVSIFYTPSGKLLPRKWAELGQLLLSALMERLGPFNALRELLEVPFCKYAGLSSRLAL